MKLHIAHLYPEQMNIYGDTGNRLILQRRAEWRGIEAAITQIHPGTAIPSDVDIIVGGGGQDSGQSKVTDDLIAKAATLNDMAQDGVVMLMICGLYQLFGHYFLASDGSKMPGIGIFDASTEAGEGRMIGNISIETDFGTLVGYENHSGRTTLRGDTTPLGACSKGQGNNGQDKTEGARVYNAFGSYLHGPLLSKNPEFADALLQLALSRKYGDSVTLKPLDDTPELAAKKTAMARPR